MKTLKLLSILSCIVLGSCSKDDDNTDQAKDTLFTGYKYSTNENVFDFSYNSDGQLTTFESFDNFGNLITNDIVKTNGLLTKVGLATLFYNASNQNSQIDDGTGEGATSMTYDDQGKLIQQSTSHSGGSLTEDKFFTYTSGKVSEVIVHIVGGTVNTYYKFDINYSLNNISQVVISISDNNIDYVLEVTSNYTYDNKKNPFKMIIDAVGFDNFYIEPTGAFRRFSTERFNYIGAYPFAWISDNNITKMVSVYDSGSYTANYTYSYNADGYPTELTFIDGEDDHAMEYYYTQQ